ncbi:N/A [soil metagenome]
MAAVDIFMQRVITDDRWMNDASCRGLTDLFFPPPAERPQARDRREAHARDLCASCNSADRCRQFARTHHEYGLWGGESEEERHAAGYRLIAPIGVRARIG